MLAELEALPDDSYLTMIRSPELFYAAFWGAPERLAAAVQTWIAVERARPGAATPLDGIMRAQRVISNFSHLHIASRLTQPSAQNLSRCQLQPSWPKSRAASCAC